MEKWQVEVEDGTLRCMKGGEVVYFESLPPSTTRDEAAFLGLVEALKLARTLGYVGPIQVNSVLALHWLRQRKVTVNREKSGRLLQAEAWLQTSGAINPIEFEEGAAA